MRFEIIVPESTDADLQARLSSLTKSLRERPELVQELTFEGDEDEAIQLMFTPERLARIASAKAEINTRLGLKLEEADERLAANKAAWLAENGA